MILLVQPLAAGAFRAHHYLAPGESPGSKLRGTRSGRRRGVSLLEVLIAIGVLSIGLLGVAAVIPVARFAIMQTAKADRAAACGHAALRDIIVRGMINPHDWRDVQVGWPVGKAEPNTSGQPYFSARQGFVLGESYAIDPLYAANSKSGGANPVFITDFPYNVRTPGTPLYPLLNGHEWTRMQRVAWITVGSIDPALIGKVFMWRDDLVIPVPDDDTLRPEQLMVLGNPLQALQAQNKGDYTWMVTVTPAAENYDFIFPENNLPYSYSENAPLYTVSVVVFYKRDWTPPDGFGSGDTPGERQVRLTFLSAGLNGGDVLLSNFAVGEPPEYLDVKEGEWLMASGWYPYQYVDSTGQGRLRPVGVHKWYRIVATSETVVEDSDGNGALDPGEDVNGNGVLDPPFREASLAGPDWNPGWTNDWDGDGIVDVFAALVKGVVGVYTTTVESD